MDSIDSMDSTNTPSIISSMSTPKSFTPVTMESIATPKSFTPVTETRIPDIPKITTEWPSSHPMISKTTSSWSYWDFLKIFLIIIILAALGFNVFAYLYQGTDYLSNLVQKITAFLPPGIAKTLNLSLAGTKFATEIASGTIQDVEKLVDEIPEISLDAVKVEQTSDAFHKDIWDGRDKILADAIDKRQVLTDNKYPQHEPDQSTTSIQNPSSKSWCYAGTDKNFRSCVQVKNSTECMSGKIYSSKRICINPTLRE